MNSGPGWRLHSEAQIDALTAISTFRLEDWDGSRDVSYRVVSGRSQWEGTFRAEPIDATTLKLMAVACVNDKWFPYTEAVQQITAG